MPQTAIIFAMIATAVSLASAAQMPPTEPIDVGHAPQFVFDNYVVDNHWAIKYKRQSVQRVFHQPVKHPGNPVLTADQASFLWVVRDAEVGVFRMYYQANYQVADDKAKGRKYRTHIAYAESKDGLEWKRPDLGLFAWHDAKPNNVVIAWPDNPKGETCTPCILDVPEHARRGYKYLMMYRGKGVADPDVLGIRIIGSHDGIHWDRASDRVIAHLHSDHHNTVSWDPRRGEYVMYCRPKHIYRTTRGAMLDTGASRRVARVSSPELWTDWLARTAPQTILIPDEMDSEKHFNFFYGMPTRQWAGVYWGFLEPFRMNDFIYTELVVGRDGVHFTRLPGRPKLIEWGEGGAWDDTMIFVSPSWVEVGDEWWFYYSGWDGPHGTTDRTGGIGLAKVRKEGLIGMRGPKGGGVACTRQIRWPGGALYVNADATNGLLRVRVSDERRKPIDGFDYTDCEALSGDSVRQEVKWGERSHDELSDRIVRLEFYLQDAELFTFCAGE